MGRKENAGLSFNLGSYNLTCKKQILYLSDYVFLAPADPAVPEGTVTGEVPGAAASTRDSGHSTAVKSARKQKSVEQGTYYSLT